MYVSCDRIVYGVFFVVFLPLEENAKYKEEEILVGRVWLLGLRGPVVGSFGFRSRSGRLEAAQEANLYPGRSLRTKEPVSPVATGNGRGGTAQA